ncbi:MAG: ATP-binding cassette domain-containing protein [Colwellia sp.]
MPTLQVNKLSYQLDNGIKLFENISFRLPQGLTALIGRNGVGKSILVSLLTKELKPTSGTISSEMSILSFNQNHSMCFKKEETVSSFLGVDKQLAALNRIEQGDYEESDFELLAEHWQIKDDVLKILKTLRLPVNFNLLCVSLSGGERAKLSLWQLFQSDAQLLILDEPSNHLDKQGKHWLMNQMKNYQGNVLLVSHDHELLQQVDSIYELSSLGLTFFHGAYSDYLCHKQNNDEALDRKRLHLNKQKKKVLKQAQKSKEKAQKRASQGNRLRHSGSQAKVLLDGKKNKAEGAASSKATQSKARMLNIASKQALLLTQKEPIKPLSLSMHHEKNKKAQQLYIEEVVLPFGSKEPINLQVMNNEKFHLVGENGSGKSTFLKVLLGELRPISGNVYLNCQLFYFDQYCSLLKAQLNMLENMQQHCAYLNDMDLRTLLAGIGFRGDKVFTLVAQLSGGEKIRLMILIASHQKELPLLLLDEPDNHLDRESKEVLADALNAFNGSFILISHDEHLLNCIDNVLKIKLT